MTLAHPIPATIDALTALWSVHPDLAYLERGRRRQLLVVDGPPLAGIDDPRYLIVGAAQSLGGGQGASSRTGFGGDNRRTVPVEVSCSLGVWSGDVELAALRTTAFAVLETLGRTLAANRTLGGAVDWARIVRASYQPAQTDAGAGVAIDFAVTAEATRFEGV